MPRAGGGPGKEGWSSTERGSWEQGSPGVYLDPVTDAALKRDTVLWRACHVAVQQHIPTWWVSTLWCGLRQCKELLFHRDTCKHKLLMQCLCSHPHPLLLLCHVQLRFVTLEKKILFWKKIFHYFGKKKYTPPPPKKPIKTKQKTTVLGVEWGKCHFIIVRKARIFKA